MEHARWRAERWLAGWSYANIPQQDEDRKLHPDLLPYDELPAREGEIDKAMSDICHILSKIGYGVVALPGSGKSGGESSYPWVGASGAGPACSSVRPHGGRRVGGRLKADRENWS